MKQARGLVERAIQVALENASYRVTLGQIFDKAGELPLAAAAYEAAVTLDPLDAETYFTLAGAWKRMGHFDAAIQCYEKNHWRFSPTTHPLFTIWEMHSKWQGGWKKRLRRIALHLLFSPGSYRSLKTSEQPKGT